jgi:uncharacterized protein (TIGR00375 family)
MRSFYADLHIHIGRSGGRPVKVTAARDLTFANIARECATRKGIDIAGIVDCASPPVLQEIRECIAGGKMVELAEGGLRYQDETTIVLGCELETLEPTGGMSHHISYFPTVSQLAEFSARLSEFVTNISLSSQQCHMPAQHLWEITHRVGGVFVPAHVFTPHKSIYGACAARLSQVFDGEALADLTAIELGLSADAELGDRIDELATRTFLSNSDAHSLPRIGREYNVLKVEAPTFREVALALRREAGRRVAANFGLDPRLGKYHRTSCLDCGWIEQGAPPARVCARCDSARVTKGVLDRIVEIQDSEGPRPPGHRPRYQYQVPLQFVPKIGSVTLNKLLNRFGTEMAVLHRVGEEELAQVVGEQLSHRIVLAREGRLPIRAGGGGRYGRAAGEPGETQLDLGMRE